MSEPRKVSLCARLGGLYVDASVRPDGGLQISGQDLSGDEEYEYEITVAADDVPLVVAALGGAAGDDVLDLLVAHATEVVATGELTWLRSLGIEPALWTH